MRLGRATCLPSATIASCCRAELDDGFKRSAVSHTLTVVDASRLTIRVQHAFHLRCTHPSRFVFSRYDWTGSGDESSPRIGPPAPDSSLPSPRLHGPAIKVDGGGRLLVIDLGRIYEPGEECDLEVDHTFVDIRRTFQPFLTHRVTDGNEIVDLAVRIPSALPVVVHSTQELVESAHKESVRVAGTELSVGGVPYVEYRSTVHDPAVGRRYAIRWTW